MNLCADSTSCAGIVRHSSPWYRRRTSPPNTKPDQHERPALTASQLYPLIYDSSHLPGADISSLGSGPYYFKLAKYFSSQRPRIFLATYELRFASSSAIMHEQSFDDFIFKFTFFMTSKCAAGLSLLFMTAH